MRPVPCSRNESVQRWMCILANSTCSLAEAICGPAGTCRSRAAIAAALPAPPAAPANPIRGSANPSRGPANPSRRRRPLLPVCKSLLRACERDLWTRAESRRSVAGGRGAATPICRPADRTCGHVVGRCERAGDGRAAADAICGLTNGFCRPAENSCKCAGAGIESARPRHLRSTHTHTRSCPRRRTNPQGRCFHATPLTGATQNLNRPTTKE